MKILLMFRSCHPGLSGADHMALQTARALVATTGHEVMLAQRFVDRKPYEIFEEQGVMRAALPTDPLKAVPWLLGQRFDRLHLIDFVDASFLKLALHLQEGSGCPLFVTPATDLLLWEDVPLGLRLCRAADWVLTLTEAERELICLRADLDPASCIVIPHGPHLVEAEPPLDFKKKNGLPETSLLVLFVGRKLPSKGYQLLLEAAKRVLAEFPEARLVFVGPDTEESQAVFERYKGERRIVNLGLVSDEVKTAAIKACDVLCLPSTVDVFPLVFLEAWACGKPVIASHQHGIEEVVRQEVDGLVVLPVVEEVARGVTRLLADQNFARQLGECGRQRVFRTHTWERVASLLEKCYEMSEKSGVKRR